MTEQSIRSTILGLVLVAGGCGDETMDPMNTNTPMAAADPCAREALEADRQMTTMVGPAVDASGALKPPSAGRQYIVSATYLRLKGDAAAQQRFQEVVRPVIEALGTQRGLLAIQTSSSASCGTARTLSVWEDEASMYTFVGGPAHAAAMAAVSEISRGGSLTTHWIARTASEATWDESALKLKASNKSTY